METCSIVFVVILLTNQQTDTGENITLVILGKSMYNEDSQSTMSILAVMETVKFVSFGQDLENISI